MNSEYYFDNDILQKLENSNLDTNESVKICHDIVLRLIINSKDFKESYKGESDNISWLIVEDLYISKYKKTNRIQITRDYLEKIIPIKINEYRTNYEYYPDYPKRFKVDSDLNDSIRLISGLKDFSLKEFERIRLSDSKRVLNPDDLISYVMDKYCMYDKYTIEYKYLAISLMNSIINLRVMLHPKLDKILVDHLKYLIKQYSRYNDQFLTNEVIYIET